MRDVSGSWTQYPQRDVGEVYVSYESKDLLAGEGNQVWWMGNKQILRYDGEMWAAFTASQGLGAVYQFIGLGMDRNGIVWAAHDHGALQFDGESWNNLVDTGEVEVLSMFVHPQGAVWLGIDSGFLVFEAGDLTEYGIEAEEITGPGAQTLAVDDRGRVWYGTSWGLQVLEGNEWVTYHMYDSSLEGDDIEEIVVFGGGPAGLPEKENKANGAISGVLTLDGAPLTGAEIEVCVSDLFMLSSEEPPCDGSPIVRSVTTGGDGSFSFNDLPPSWYSLSYRVEGENVWTILTAGIAGGSTRRILVEPEEMNDLGILALTSD
jgi:hypothetical protein